MRVRGRGPWAFAGIVTLLAVLAGCGGDGGAQPTPTAPPTIVLAATPTRISFGDPGLTVENVVGACRAKDAALLQSFVAAPLDADEVAAMFARGSDVRLAVRRPAEFDGDRASVTLTLEIDNEPQERTWELERDEDGVWRLTELPDCY